MGAPAPADAGVAPSPAERPAPAPPLPTIRDVPLGAVPIEIALRSLAGVNRFEIRLDPAELGRIEVRLDIDAGGEVKAQLVVDRVETLALLQRDARTLERAFEQAGLKPSEGGIDLSLRDPSHQGGGAQGRGDGQAGRGQGLPGRNGPPGDGSATLTPPVPARTVWRGSAGGIDLHV